MVGAGSIGGLLAAHLATVADVFVLTRRSEHARLLNEKLGRENTMMVYPTLLSWLPNIRREDYRSSGMYSTFGKGESTPVVPPAPA